jgi:hypothetical protein
MVSCEDLIAVIFGFLFFPKCPPRSNYMYHSSAPQSLALGLLNETKRVREREENKKHNSAGLNDETETFEAKKTGFGKERTREWRNEQ